MSKFLFACVCLYSGVLYGMEVVSVPEQRQPDVENGRIEEIHGRTPKHLEHELAHYAGCTKLHAAVATGIPCGLLGVFGCFGILPSWLGPVGITSYIASLVWMSRMQFQNMIARGAIKRYEESDPEAFPNIVNAMHGGPTELTRDDLALIFKGQPLYHSLGRSEQLSTSEISPQHVLLALHSELPLEQGSPKQLKDRDGGFDV